MGRLPIPSSFRKLGQLEVFTTQTHLIVDSFNVATVGGNPGAYRPAIWLPTPADDYQREAGHCYFGYQMRCLPIALINLYAGNDSPYRGYFYQFDSAAVLSYRDVVSIDVDPHPSVTTTGTGTPPVNTHIATALRYDPVVVAYYRDPTGNTSTDVLSGPAFFSQCRRLGTAKVCRSGRTVTVTENNPNVYGFGAINRRPTPPNVADQFLGGVGRKMAGAFVVKVHGLDQYAGDLMFGGPFVVIRTPAHTIYGQSGEMLYAALRCRIRITRTYFILFMRRDPLFKTRSLDTALTPEFPRFGAAGMRTAATYEGTFANDADDAAPFPPPPAPPPPDP